MKYNHPFAGVPEFAPGGLVLTAAKHQPNPEKVWRGSAFSEWPSGVVAAARPARPEPFSAVLIY